MPALAIVSLDPLVGFRVIRNLHFLTVPQQLPRITKGQIAEDNPFGERSCIVKVGAGRSTTFAGTNPVAVMSRRTTQDWFRKLVVFHHFVRQQPSAVPIRPGSRNSFVADKQGAIVTISQFD